MSAPNPLFTGEANLAPLTTFADGPVKVADVSFTDGAVTHWHSHEGGQMLVVCEGQGRTQERGGPIVTLAPGDVVKVEPGVEHWHGAIEGCSMRHVAIHAGTTTWGEAPFAADGQPASAG